MDNPFDKFQQLLRELFQFDCADLDFGIYRIMNHKHDVIERFITRDLPGMVAAELERGALAEQSQAARELEATSNYLLGLYVRARRVYDDRGRCCLVYRGRIDHREIAVIWRDTEGWQQADFERDRQVVAEHKLADSAGEVFINGDSFIPSAQALEPIFKARMFAPVEA